MNSLSKSMTEKSSDSMTGKSSDNGSNSSGGGGSGNNSDNSALVSLGNTSFGFNFDDEEREERMNSSPRNSNSEEGDSDGNTNFHRNQSKANGNRGQSGRTEPHKAKNPSVMVLPKRDPTKTTHSEAAAAAVANLQSIANASSKKLTNKGTILEIVWR
jgi:hypothetical protein